MRGVAAAAGLLGAAMACVAGCVVEPIDLNGHTCDEEHACVDGYTCIDGECENDEGASSD